MDSGSRTYLRSTPWFRLSLPPSLLGPSPSRSVVYTLQMQWRSYYRPFLGDSFAVAGTVVHDDPFGRFVGSIPRTSIRALSANPYSLSTPKQELNSKRHGETERRLWKTVETSSSRRRYRAFKRHIMCRSTFEFEAPITSLPFELPLN